MKWSQSIQTTAGVGQALLMQRSSDGFQYQPAPTLPSPPSPKFYLAETVSLSPLQQTLCSIAKPHQSQ